MVPGFSDTECRIAEYRIRDQQAEAERQRRVTAGRRQRAAAPGTQLTMSSQLREIASLGIRFIGTVRFTRLPRHAAGASA